jgi:hypothetical protein
MPEIREIFLWYRSQPTMPSDSTTLQQEEWKQRHSADLLNHFSGQSVTSCVARIYDVTAEAISAYASYDFDYLVHDGKHFHHERGTSRRQYAQIQYKVAYHDSAWVEKVRSLRQGQMVEFDATVIDAEWSSGGYSPEYVLSLRVALKSISTIESRFLHAELLDSALAYSRSGCFVATAAFGSAQAPEVQVLRRFRDAVLNSHMAGRLLIRGYYRVSPPLATLVSRHPNLRSAARLLLGSIVQWLSARE